MLLIMVSLRNNLDGNLIIIRFLLTLHYWEVIWAIDWVCEDLQIDNHLKTLKDIFKYVFKAI